MHRGAALVLLATVFIVILLPSAIVAFGRGGASLPEPQEEEEGAERENAGLTLRVFEADKDRVVEMDLEEYLMGVVMAEMPVEFALEALKAQAVAARTFTLQRSRRLGGEGCRKAPEAADICTDSTHCQDWIDPELGAGRWPAEKREEYLDKIRQAVQETAGEVLTFEGELIEAVYHSTCGGETEVPQAVWSGGPVAYLPSQPCPYCAHSPHYRSQMEVAWEKLASSLELDLPIPAVSGVQPTVKVVQETPGGRVGQLQVGEAVIPGKELRLKLGLPSTAFEWEADDRGLRLTLRGYGHGVGLCQYGADGAASQGKSYREILDFYYPGCSLVKID